MVVGAANHSALLQHSIAKLPQTFLWHRLLGSIASDGKCFSFKKWKRGIKQSKRLKLKREGRETTTEYFLNMDPTRCLSIYFRPFLNTMTNIVRYVLNGQIIDGVHGIDSNPGPQDETRRRRPITWPLASHSPMNFLQWSVSQSVWSDLAKFRHFGINLKVLGKFLKDYVVFGKILTLLWQKCLTIVQVLIVADGQILKNNLAIWSRWSQ